jgi:hypothetical protein
VSVTPILAPNARRYLEEVRRALADLPETERDALLADVEAHVVEVSEETGDELVARLGSPGAFAAELRSAAGLPPGGAGASGSDAVERLGAAVRRLGERIAPLRRPLAELAPAWWVLRGYVVATLMAWAFLSTGTPAGWLPPTGSRATALLLLLAAVAGSVWLGLRTRAPTPSRRARMALAVLNAALALGAVLIAVEVERNATTTTFVEAGFAAPGLTSDGVPVQNVYPVDRDGRPLADVRLFDQDGQPLAILPDDGDPTRRAVVDARGERADNAVPLRYLEPGGDEVTDPLAGYPADVPPLATPPVAGAPAEQAGAPRGGRERRRAAARRRAP